MEAFLFCSEQLKQLSYGYGCDLDRRDLDISACPDLDEKASQSRSDLLLYLICHKGPKMNLCLHDLAVVRLVYIVTDAGHAHNSPCRLGLLISIVMQGRSVCGTIAAMGPCSGEEETRALEPG